MNFLITSDEKYIKPLSVSIFSLCKNSKKEESNVFYFSYFKSKSLSNDSKTILISSLRSCDRLEYIEIDDYELDTCNYWNNSVWLKLATLFKLPKSVKTIIYMDADIIVNGDISDFYFSSLIKTNTFVGTVEQFGKKNKEIPNDKYVCAGFILINIERFLKKFISFDDVYRSYKKLPFTPKFLEQDFINYSFKNEIGRFESQRFMFFTLWSNKRNEEIVVYHYAGSIKPWTLKHNKYPITKSFFLYWSYAIKIYGILYFLSVCFLKTVYFLVDVFKYFIRLLKGKRNRIYG